LLITLASMLATWLLFGLHVESSKKQRFIYWLKSTVFLWGALVLWVSYKEPNAGLLVSAGGSFVFSAVANLLRSQWILMFP